MPVEKLIAEYKKKIDLMDITIEKATASIRELRRTMFSGKEYNDKTAPFVEDRKIADAKRQSYVQFVVDLESLND